MEFWPFSASNKLLDLGCLFFAQTHSPQNARLMLRTSRTQISSVIPTTRVGITTDPSWLWKLLVNFSEFLQVGALPYQSHLGDVSFCSCSAGHQRRTVRRIWVFPHRCAGAERAWMGLPSGPRWLGGRWSSKGLATDSMEGSLETGWRVVDV